jgi:hypothetical protein
MNLHLFFEGSIPREPVSSAFLATLLEQRSDVRSVFFDVVSSCVGKDLAEVFKKKEWVVKVELNRVDIRLDATDESWVILLENKLQRGSMRKGQLAQYYHEQTTREPKPSILALYLAPGATAGESEVSAVRCSVSFRVRGRDFAARLSWNTIDAFLAQITTADTDGRFIRSGMNSIMRVIEDAAKLKFPNVGGREEVYDIAYRFRQGLHRSMPRMHFGPPWPAIDNFVLSSHKTNITLRFLICFDVSPSLPHVPVNLFDGEAMCVTVKSMFRISAVARRTPLLNSRWHALASIGTVDLPRVGLFHLENNGWFVLKRRLKERPGTLVAKLTRMAEPLLRFVADYDKAV